MITDAPSAVTDMLVTAAATVAGTLAASEPLTAGQPGTDPDVWEDGGHAVLAEFTGAVSGELVLVVDSELADALGNSTLGPLELTAAVAPTLDAVAIAIGPVALGPARVLDARMGLARALGHADAALVPLRGADAVRAAVAIGIDPTSTAPNAAPAASAASSTGTATVPSDRLNLLRGVEMEATAELGRAKMTVNDLLSLRNGMVIELDRVAGSPADLYVNGRLIARGEVVVIDENYGLRITQVVTDDVGR
jgi:flagellar motor switch protein FliN/FliY